MITKFYFYFLALSIIPSLSYQQCSSYYTVRPGDTCASLIATYGLNPTNFYSGNSALNCNSLQVGQVICLNYLSSGTWNTGSYSTSNGYYGCANSYTIKAGDTCSALFGADQSLFYASNPNINCNNLQIGQVICLPYAYGSSSWTSNYGTVYNTGYGCPNPYTVKAGDTCAGILSYYGQDSSSFYTNNQGINCNNLQVGQVLCLQTSYGSYAGTNYGTSYYGGYGCANPYTIKAGDTCASIISYYGQLSSSFYAANPYINCNNLQIGQVICLGTNYGTNNGATWSTGYGCSNSYTVKAGDTCASILAFNGLNSGSFYTANPTINCNNLQIGQVLCLNGAYGSNYYGSSYTSSGCSNTYTVKAGDTCAAIISYYGLNSVNFYAANSNINCNNLQIGQVLCLNYY